MQIEPSGEKFAARYAAGAPQVVWTTLVADLETPVSAFLKVAGARPKNSTPMSFLLEFGGGRRGARPLFDHRARAGPHLPRQRPVRRDQSHPAERSACLFAGRPAAACGIARTHRRKPHGAAGCAAADGRRRIRLPRLRHGAADGGFFTGAGRRPDRHSRCDPSSSDLGDCLRCGRGHDHHRHAGAAAGGGDGENGSFARV